MKNIFTLKNLLLLTAMFLTFAVNAQTVLYSTTFDNGIGTDSIVGSGKLVLDPTPGFDSVFLNGYDGVRANYFLVKDTVFGRLQASGSKELSIAFWVNKDTLTAGFYWTNMFSAYGAAPNPNNNWPMMVCETRLWFQENCAGWCDFGDTDNANGTNFISTAWLDDGNWHLYTITITEASVNIYIDGVLKNTWNINGTDGHTVAGLFTNGRDLKYICLGGNQAWDWQDVDPAFKFDDLTIYSSALTVEQINNIVATKLGTDVKQITNKETIKVFPTLATDYITLQGLKGSTKVEIIDIQGKTVASFANALANLKINVSKMRAGNYFIRISDGKNVVVKKFIRR